jgi:hypothetical protein
MTEAVNRDISGERAPSPEDRQKAQALMQMLAQAGAASRQEYKPILKLLDEIGCKYTTKDGWLRINIRELIEAEWQHMGKYQLKQPEDK